MALEGTHIRFALDVKDKYQVSDLGKYLSGAIYPDSRYVSVIDRELTHPADYSTWDVLKIDDFKKGWFVHLFYDEMQYQWMSRFMPELGEGPQGSPAWVRRTAVKNLQDIDDVLKFDIKAYLPLLDHVENPNGENIEGLRKYNRAVQDLYSKPVNNDDLILFWETLGQSGELEDQIKHAAEEYMQNQDMMGRIRKIYEETLKNWYDQ